jgi:hypothetical protein
MNRMVPTLLVEDGQERIGFVHRSNSLKDPGCHVTPHPQSCEKEGVGQ